MVVDLRQEAFGFATSHENANRTYGYVSTYANLAPVASGSAHAPIDLTSDTEQVYTKNTGRKRKSMEDSGSGEPVRASQKRKSAVGYEEREGAGSPPKKKAYKPTDGEKRLRQHRKRAPQAYAEIRHRALTQRMFVLDRQRTPPPSDIDPSSPDNHPTETISLAGTTGNVYHITISRMPSCDCPHAIKGNQCKHLVYVLHRVLRVRADLEYQLAFLSSELREIFVNAPPLPTETVDSDSGDSEEAMDGHRKPLNGEDCPICMMEFEVDAKGKAKPGEETVYCKAACGKNLHKGCFSQWAATKRGGAGVTCPFCRSLWEDVAGELGGVGGKTGLKALAKGKGRVNAEGYVNVASELGLSGQRDYSTYNEFWTRRQFGWGRW